MDGSQCDGSENSDFKGHIREYSYSGDTNRIVVNFQVSSDGSKIYTTSKGSVGAVTSFTNSVFAKHSLDLTPEWSMQMDHVVQKDAMVLDSNDQNIYFTVFDGSQCTFGKMSSEDGSVTSYKKFDSAVIECNRVALSNDDSYLYVIGRDFSNWALVNEVKTSDLSVSFSLSHSDTRILALYAFTVEEDHRNVYGVSHGSTMSSIALFTASFASFSDLTLNTAVG